MNKNRIIKEKITIEKKPVEISSNKSAKRRRQRARKAASREKFSLGGYLNVGKRLSAPVAKGLVIAPGKARIETLPGGGVRIRHSEYLLDIIGSLLFSTNVNLTVNPGDMTTFPWLSTIARRFESYLFNSLVFRYETDCPTTTTGSVQMMLDYNADAVPPVSKTEVMSADSSVRTPPWGSAEHVSSLQNLRKRSSYFVRGASVVNEAQTFDVGRFFVTTMNANPQTLFGELYVDYDIILMTPQLQSNPQVQSWLSTFQQTVPSNGMWASTGSNVNIYQGDNILTIGNLSSSAGYMSFNSAGTFLVSFQIFEWDGAYLLSSTVGVVVITQYLTTNNSSECTGWFTVRVPSIGARVNVSLTGSSGGPVQTTHLRVALWNQSLP